MVKANKTNEKSNSGELHHSLHNISVWIDSYDDIFSDFDSRTFENRNFSDDFLHEIKKFSREKESTVSGFTLLVPTLNRDFKKEDVIIKRLNHYFKDNLLQLKFKAMERIKQGLMQTLTGMLMMILASYISLIKSDQIIMHTLFVLFEPAGWFLMWIGLENLLISSSNEKADNKFYTKIARSKISFVGY